MLPRSRSRWLWRSRSRVEATVATVPLEPAPVAVADEPEELELECLQGRKSQDGDQLATIAKLSQTYAFAALQYEFVVWC